jgi:hypothetical protein
MGLKVKDIVDVGSTEGIYTLGVVTNDTYSLVIAYELEYDALLGKIGVLILVDKDEEEA